MNKKTKKIKNRLAETIQAKYSLSESQERKKSVPGDQKLKTIISQKIEISHTGKLNPKSRRVYLSNINRCSQNQNIMLTNENKEENLKTVNSQTKRRYITRVKSSNGPNMQNRSFVNQRSIRQTSKLNKLIKNLNEVQFESELYWNGSSSYLVTGVKNQYQKMKKSYEQKCIEIQKIKREYQVDLTKELKIYIDKLQKENAKLIQACQKFRNKLHKHRQVHSSLSGLVLDKHQQHGQREAIQNQLYELYERYQKLETKIQNLQTKNSKLSKQQNKLVAKIFLQQKIIIQKENRQFKLNLNCKKLEKTLAEVKQLTKRKQQNCNHLQQSTQDKLLDLEVKFKQQFMSEKKNLMDKLKDNHDKMDKMDKEIIHLKDLLSHWQQAQQAPSNSNLQNQNYTQKSRSETQRCKGSTQKHNFKTNLDCIKAEKNPIKIKFKHSIQNDLTPNNNLHHNNPTSQRSLNKSSLRSKLEPGKTTHRSTQKIIQRQRITAKTIDQNSVRCRPVELNQIEPIIEYVKLKLCFQRFNPSHLTSFFDYKDNRKHEVFLPPNDKIKDEPNQTTNQQIQVQTQKDLNQKCDDQNIPWEQQYITLRQVYETFLKVPFQIRDSEALLLSRFIIEDVKQPYVYMNWDSQNARRMVKSIIGNLLNFDTLSDKTIQKSEELLKKYETVLMLALRSMTAKTGKISKEKFIEIVNGLGLERTVYMEEYIIGKMCCSSFGLNGLQFASLYKQNCFI